MSLYTISASALSIPIATPSDTILVESANVELLAALASTTIDEVTRRLANDNQAFVAYVKGQPAAFGWVAKGKARIGELNHEMILPVGHRYLWNFRTSSEFRGRGIYPALLNHILRLEPAQARRFWIIHAPENKSSRSGIVKAGFQYVGRLYSSEGKAHIDLNSNTHHFKSDLEQLGIEVSQEQPASCWNCTSPYLKKRQAECCCSPEGVRCAIENSIAIL
jgi:ribosomal protein S18 acetylase RimI-like enzyme